MKLSNYCTQENHNTADNNTVSSTNELRLLEIPGICRIKVIVVKNRKANSD